jgi:hypothetical protein
MGTLVGSIAATAIGTIADTVVDCLFGCEGGIVKTALKNAIVAGLTSLTFGASDMALEEAKASVGAKSLNALGEYLAGQVINNVSG